MVQIKANYYYQDFENSFNTKHFYLSDSILLLNKKMFISNVHMCIYEDKYMHICIITWLI